MFFQDVHKISLQEYEQRVGMPNEGMLEAEEEVMAEDIDSSELEATADTLSSSSSASAVEENSASGNELATFDCSSNIPRASDIKNPRNKVCRPCNREFNRRQAFVEHCRNIHAMKIDFGSNGAVQISGGNAAPSQYITAAAPPPPRSPKSTTAISFPCEFCGKVYSNRSNRNRHKILCDVKKVAEECPSCDYTGVYDSVRQHYKRTHLKREKKTFHEAKREREAKRDPSSFPFSCKICGMKFKKYLGHYFHNLRTHKKETKNLTTMKRTAKKSCRSLTKPGNAKSEEN